MLYSKKLLLVLVTALSVIGAPFSAYAQTSTTGEPEASPLTPTTAEPLPGSIGFSILEDLYFLNDYLGLPNVDLGVVIGRLLRVVLGFVGIILVLLIIYAGLLWMTAGGDEEKTSKAKRTLINAIIGLIIIFSARAIVEYAVRLLTAPATSSAL